jgi:hypothetical protein
MASRGVDLECLLSLDMPFFLIKKKSTGVRMYQENLHVKPRLFLAAVS